MFTLTEASVRIFHRVASLVVDGFKGAKLVQPVVELGFAVVRSSFCGQLGAVFFKHRIGDTGPVRTEVRVLGDASFIATLATSQFSILVGAAL